MESHNDLIKIIRSTLKDFCKEFFANPYLCYTEHGFHAYLYTLLFNHLHSDQKFIIVNNQTMCVVQKEYCTADRLGKSKRQHWDISIIKKPPGATYDKLPLAAAMEFGMNSNEKHLKEDIRRLCHSEANIGHGFIVHLHRIGNLSGRDLSPRSKRIVPLNRIEELVNGKKLEAYYVLTGEIQNGKGAWHISEQGTEKYA